MDSSMHGLETPPKDPRGTVASVFGVLVLAYLLAVVTYNLWEAWK